MKNITMVPLSITSILAGFNIVFQYGFKWYFSHVRLSILFSGSEPFALTDFIFLLVAAIILVSYLVIVLNIIYYYYLD